MKIFTHFLITLLLCCLKMNAQGDLVLDYTFEGNAHDNSGNNNNGTVYDATLTEDRFGNPDSAYNFNGTSSYIEFQANGSMSQIYDTGEFTISAWIKIRNWYNNWNVFSILEQYNPNTDYGSLLLEANWATGGINFVAGYEAQSVGCNFNWNFNQWYNITVTYRIASGEINFYIDGNLIQTVPYNQDFSQDNIHSYVIGRSLSGPDEYSDGIIDDLKIFKRALTSDEVGTLVSTGHLSIKDIASHSAGIKLFPNPASDYIHVSSKAKILFVQIFDMSGRIIGSFNNIQSNRLEVSQLAKGTYFLQVDTEQESENVKFIKK